eukprot:782829-Amphidinium_carterae.1
MCVAGRMVPLLGLPTSFRGNSQGGSQNSGTHPRRPRQEAVSSPCASPSVSCAARDKDTNPVANCQFLSPHTHASLFTSRMKGRRSMLSKHVTRSLAYNVRQSKT